MERFDKSKDETIRQKLQQHEFDFDSSAWDAMSEQLDRKGGVQNDPLIFSINNSRSRWSWLDLFFILAFLLIGGFFALRSELNVVSASINISSEKEFTSKDQAIMPSTIVDPIDYPTLATDTTSKDTPKEKVQENALPSNVPSSEQEVSNTTNQNNSLSSSTFSSRKESFNKISDRLGQNNNNISNDSGAEDGTPYLSTSEVLSSTIQSKQNTTSIKADSHSTISEVHLSKNSIASTTTNTHLLQQLKLSAIATVSFLDSSQEQEIKDLIPDNFLKIRRPHRWYLGAQAGFYFPKIGESKTNINQEIFVSRINSKAFYLGAYVGYHLNEKIRAELGLGYSAIPYILQYTYYTNPATKNWNLENVDQKIHQWTLPLRFQIDMWENLRGSFGGGIGYRSLNQKFSQSYQAPVGGEEIYPLFKDNYRMVLGFWEAGIAYDRGSWTLDLRYQRFLGNVFSPFRFEGHQFQSNAKEWAFILAFGHRRQKYSEPVKEVDFSKTIPSPKYYEKGFYWGLGIATGMDKYRAGESVGGINFHINSFASPLKLNAFTYYAFKSPMRVEAGVWWQKSEVNYYIDSGLDLDTILVGQMGINRLEIPLSVHYCFRSHIRFFAGGGLEINWAKNTGVPFESATNTDVVDFYNKLPKAHKKIQVIGEVGIAYDWRQFAFELRYRKPLASRNAFLNPLTYHGQTYTPFSVRNQMILGINYIINKH